MVKALIDIDEHANRVLNIVKAKYNLKDKSQAINVMANRFEEEILEPQLRPEFIERMKKIEKEKTVSVKDFEKEFGLS
ncbi:MAG: DUF2683 family protein [Candidatus Aenigmarchaeota archaeon]|nr:DUF2683 family protein [Candidatus Aenigmarchaeota archaeon]